MEVIKRHDSGFLDQPPTLFTGASTVTGARLADLIRSLAETVEDVEDTGEAVEVGDSVDVVAISDIGLTLGPLLLLV